MQWERRQRRLTAPAFILDPIDFGERWRKWITSMMPGWRTRKSTEWPLPREDRPDERWDAIRKGGRDGVLLLVLSLSWWKHATTPGTKARDEYESAVEELAWLLQQLVRVPPSALPVTSSASRTSSVQPDFVPPPIVRWPTFVRAAVSSGSTFRCRSQAEGPRQHIASVAATHS